MADYLTFADIQAEVELGIKDMSSTKATLVKGIINQVYLTEIPAVDPFYPLFWLLDLDDSLKAKPYAAITAISKATPCLITAANSFVQGDIISLYDIVGMAELNNRTFQVGSGAKGLDSGHIPLWDMDGNDVSSTNMTTYVSGGIVSHRGVTLATSGKNVDQIVSAGFATYDPMNPIALDELESRGVYWWNDSVTRPVRFQHRKFFNSSGSETNQLWWFPGSDATYQLRYWYAKRLARLVNNTDVPLLPPQFHEALVSGSIARLAENQVQVENQVVWPNLYKMHQQSIIDFNREWWEDHKSTTKTKPYLL